MSAQIYSKEIESKLSMISDVDKKISTLTSALLSLRQDERNLLTEIQKLQYNFDNRVDCGGLKMSCNRKWGEPLELNKQKLETLRKNILAMEEDIKKLTQVSSDLKASVREIEQSIIDLNKSNPEFVKEQKELASEYAKIEEEKSKGSMYIVVFGVVLVIGIVAYFIYKKK